MKKDLLKMKKELLALTLAGTYMLGLTGCGFSETSNNNQNETKSGDTKAEEVSEIPKRKEQLVCIYPDRALIIEPLYMMCPKYGSYYAISLNESDEYMMVPMSEFIYIESDFPITAEEYVNIVCGPDFPIEYIRSEDYAIKR